MFYTFMQNNSGGYYLRDENVEEVIIIQSDSEENANNKLWSIVEDDYMEACECCGSRWGLWNNDGEYDVPMIFGSPVEEDEHYSYIIYYADGTKKRVEK